MAKIVDISKYQPPIIKDIREFNIIAKCQNDELSKLWIQTDYAWADQYIDELSEYGCKRWEFILGVNPKNTDTLPDRRIRIKSKLNEKLPFTKLTLINILNSICGEENYSLSILYNEYKIKILLELTVKKQFDIVAQTLDNILPANLIREIELRYNQHLNLKGIEHQALSKFTHNGLREEDFS